MPSLGSITKTIRLSAEDKEKVEGMMKDGGLTWSGAVHRLICEFDRGTPTEFKRQDLMDKAVERELRQMCRLSGISTHDFFRGVSELWERGKIEIDREKVKCNGELDVKRFMYVCYKHKMKPQEMIDKLAERIDA